MGTGVHSGSGAGIVVATGARTLFGRIAAGLGTRQLDTEFQVGLRKFSMLLVYVAGALTATIFVINVVLHKPIIDALLVSLAIAVGITPQLLPGVVSTSLAAGSRRMSRRKVLVERLVCIEDLRDVDVLFTDKTGTLTLGRVDYMRAIPAGAGGPGQVLRWGLLCTQEAGGGNPLDQALLMSPAAVAERHEVDGFTRLAVLPFDHERRMVSVLVRDAEGAHTLITKGVPETVIDRCGGVPPAARTALEVEFDAGTASSPSPPARCPARARRRQPTSTACAWPGCWSSWTHPNTMPPRPCNAWRLSASRSRSSPATTRWWPSRCATSSGWPGPRR
jgi:P-type Mg2+ transporter